jgi:integrase
VKMKLTAAAIAGLTLPDGKAEDICFDENLACFGVRVRSSGHKSYVIQYATGDKGKRRTKRIPLGKVTEIEFGKARNIAKDMLAKIRLGQDPAHDKAKARARASETFGSLVKLFMIHQQATLKPRSLKETDRHLFKMCKSLHPLPITAINRRIVAERLVSISETNGPAAANRARGSLGAFFSWAIGSGLIDINPTSLVPKAAENGPRSRRLSDTELGLLWQALGADDYATVVRLLVLTGLRRSEVGELLWTEVDLEAGLIRLPPSRTKNGREHLVPLSAPVRALLERQPRHGDRDRVFRVSAWNNAKAALDRRITEFNNGTPLTPWVLHDLRRVFSTRLHDDLVAPHVVEVLLGHTTHKNGVSGVYNQAQYLAECRRALDKWAARIMAIVTGEQEAPAQIIQLRA